MALSQADINEINALIAGYINDNKTKVSTLPEAQSLTGLWILGVSAGASVRASMALLEGLDGKNPELRNTGIELQWRVEGGTWAKLADIADIRGFKQMLQKTSTEIQSKYENEQQWQTLLTLSELKGEKGDAFAYSDFTPTQLAALKGDSGDEVSLQTTSTHIQWRLGTGSWTNLVALADLKGLKGDPGATIELQKTSTHVQWRVIGASTWNNLITLEELKVKGDTGASVELQKTATYIQWRVVGSPTWTNLIALSELKVKGDPGENIELQKTSTHVQWRVVGGSWANLISLSDLKGDTGASVELQVTATYIQWRVQGTSTWSNLIALSELKGAQGNNIELQKTATYIQWRVAGGSWANLVALADLKGDQGQGLPTGGSTGQQLVKKSAANYDYEWQTPAGAGDMLKSVYDPSGKNGDAFSQDNMKDGTVNKNFTVTDRNNIAGKYEKPGTGIPKADLAEAVQASLGKADTALQSFTETDPTVPSWAKAASKPSYSYTEITGTKPPTDAQKNSDITKAEIEAKLTGTITTHGHTVTKANVGLGNVDNTSDANKPVSTAQQSALNDKLDANKMQVVASLPASPVSGTFYFVKE